MASGTLTENYNPRIKFNSDYPIEHPNNKGYLDMLSALLLTRSKTSAKPYYKKHKGVKDSGKPGKDLTITQDDIRKVIIKSNGKSPNGVSIYFGPHGILQEPGRAKQIGLLTEDENNRFPSIDRIDSTKGYIPGNIQLTTKSYNLGKSSDNVLPTYQIDKTITVSIDYKGVKMETEMTASFFANVVKELGN